MRRFALSVLPALLPALLLIGLSASLAHAVDAAAKPVVATTLSSLKPACRETDRLNDRREMTCTIPSTDKPRRFQFRAMFSGGHDDTSASLQPTLNDQPLTCDDGSKPRLFGEDGLVSVHCAFTSAATAGKPATLKVLIVWSHAEYEDFDFLAD